MEGRQEAYLDSHRPEPLEQIAKSQSPAANPNQQPNSGLLENPLVGQEEVINLPGVFPLPELRDEERDELEIALDNEPDMPVFDRKLIVDKSHRMSLSITFEEDCDHCIFTSQGFWDRIQSEVKQANLFMPTIKDQGDRIICHPSRNTPIPHDLMFRYRVGLLGNVWT